MFKPDNEAYLPPPTVIEPPVSVPWYTCDPSEFPRRWKYVKRAQKLAQLRRLSTSQGEPDTAPQGELEHPKDTDSPQHNDQGQDQAVQGVSDNSVQGAKKSWASIIKSKTSAPKSGRKVDKSADEAHKGGGDSTVQESTPTSVLASSSSSPAAVNVAPAPGGSTATAVGGGRLALGRVIEEQMASPEELSYYDPTVHTRHEPRGLINTGNLCFMNSVLQVLIHCTPFYRMIEHIGQRAAFTLRSETPILDGLVDFTREFNQRPSSPSADGNFTPVEEAAAAAAGALPVAPFVPESFYRVLTSQARFSHLERGRQEDAQEFLGYLLEELHEECWRAINSKKDGEGEYGSASGSSSPRVSEGSEWVQVTKKKYNTRYSGTVGMETPITRMFGGQFESVLRVPTQSKPSITYDPFQHVQLDISDPKVQSIEDAFRLMSTAESIPYRTSQGTTVNATKQVFLNKLPPVLIVHLKRFVYAGNESRKLAKHIGYGTHLDIPPECMSTSTQPVPVSYSLFAVVYHHGASATAGHYTVDVKGGPHGERDKWTNIDDIMIQSIDQVGQGADSHKTAYLLFYVRNANV